MPGFVVGPLGRGITAADVKPFYTYTWEIPTLFGDSIAGATIFLRDCTLPAFTASREEVDGASVVYKYASMVNWEDVRLTFYDIPRHESSDYDTGRKYSSGYVVLADALRIWRDRVWTPQGGLGFADDYKKITHIFVFNMDSSEGYVWTLHGSWPQSIRDGDLTYTRSDVKQVDIVVAYDWATVATTSFGEFGPKMIESELKLIGGEADQERMPSLDYY